MLEPLLPYKMFIIPFIVIVIAQMIKFMRYTVRHGLNWDYLFAPGHFPSAHSAFVAALIVCVGFYDGVDSSTFAVAACFAFLTVYDAMRVRLHIGMQGKTLNMLVAELDQLDEAKFPPLKERVGHFANEVAGGIALGILLSLCIIWIIEVLL